jgi:hypothetical protein
MKKRQGEGARSSGPSSWVPLDDPVLPVVHDEVGASGVARTTKEDLCAPNTLRHQDTLLSTLPQKKDSLYGLDSKQCKARDLCEVQ